MLQSKDNLTDLKYLQCLSELYPNIASASMEIIKLEAILNLPKGTEHFITDIHGEYEAFSHVLKNGSGSVKKKIDDVFGHTLTHADKKSLATLIYYPKEKMDIVKKTEKHIKDWYKIILYRLIEITKTIASKYTRTKVREAMPDDYAFVIEELITEKPEILDKEAYYESIVKTIIQIGRAEEFIVALSELIQRLAVDRLHILGDIYDRGPAPHKIMDKLMKYHSLDIQWGNHDVVWMGAAVGQLACIATVIRNSARYGNIDIIEDGYGINLLPLATFAIETYKDDPCSCFKIDKTHSSNSVETALQMKMHKAIAVIQFNLEGQLINRYPSFGMDNRQLLHLIDYDKGTIFYEGKTYNLLDKNFPTINPDSPYDLTAEEQFVMDRLKSAFEHCEKLQRHMQLLLNKGSLYKICNGNL
ncbi:MAG: fructose-bisphosphatase class III, partial [Ruminococcus sp.]|nr:fructose-bisphosphatase class III [Ruminococcus sp.]